MLLTFNIATSSVWITEYDKMSKSDIVMFIFMIIGLIVITAGAIFLYFGYTTRCRDWSIIPTTYTQDIDFVVSWVDSSDPAWCARRGHYKATKSEHDDRRFGFGEVTNIEIETCIRSILKYAPWCRYIWIVTDNQTPNFMSSLKGADKLKVKIANHQDFFIDKTILPTFNSHTIEANLYNINGLCERFIYMNDDFYFTSYVSPDHYYDCDYPLYRSTKIINVKKFSIIKRFMHFINPSSDIYLACSSNLSPYDNGLFIWRYDHHAVPLTRSMFGDHVKTKIKDMTTKMMCCTRFRSEKDIPPIHCAVLQALEDKKCNMYDGEYYQTHYSEKIKNNRNFREYHEVCINNTSTVDEARLIQTKVLNT